MKVRFAPSPTGLLHVGNARPALLNWLMARQAGGSFLLRVDDTDTERSRAEYAEAIKEDLRWLGLDWDEVAVQSERLERYHLAADQLKASGRLYACYETPEELSLKRKVALQAARPPIYDRGALKLTDEDRSKFEAEGRKPHWRFKLEHEDIEWEDLARGAVHFNGANLTDPVLIREDDRPLYTLSSVVDDIELEVTHILRGEDHVSNTAVQIQLFAALGGGVPAFAHLPLIADASGQGLSKRLGSLSLQSLRESGLEAMAINSYLSRLGSSEAIEPITELAELTRTFDISRFSRGTPRFDPEELNLLNARILHQLNFDSVRSRLSEDFDETLWNAVRPNLTKLSDAKLWHDICRGSVTPVIEDAAFTQSAAEQLPPEPWDETTWGGLTSALKASSGRKGKALFMPLRLALTGLDHGPELKVLLPLIGRKRAEARLRGETA